MHAAAAKIVAAEMVRNDITKFGIPKERKEDVEAYFLRQKELLNDHIRGAFSNLVFHDKSGIKVQNISASGYAKAKSGTEMLALQLKNMNRVNTEPLDPSFYVMEFVWPKGSPSITVKNLFNTFHQVPGLEIPASKELFLSTVKRGIEENVWILKVTEKIYSSKNMPGFISIDDMSELFTLKEAQRLGFFDEKVTEPQKKTGGQTAHPPTPKVLPIVNHA